MKTNRFLLTGAIALFAIQAFSQNPSRRTSETAKDPVPAYKFSVSTPYLTFLNFGSEKTNTHHYEFHFEYQLTPQDKFGIKVSTWKLFAPMGIPLGDTLFLKESEFFPGRLSESGLGVTYQRLVWKGLFASVEILPIWKRYLDENKNKIGSVSSYIRLTTLGIMYPCLKAGFILNHRFIAIIG